LIGRSVNYERLDDGIEVMGRLTQDLTGVSASENAADAGRAASTPSAGDMDRVRAEADAAAMAKAAADARAKADADAKAAAKAKASPKRGRQSGGAAFGYGALNLAVGLGSFIQGDVGGGFLTLLSYGASAGLIAWELSLDYDDDLAGMLGPMGLGVAGFAVLYGFIRPLVFNNSRPLAELMDNIDIAVIPQTDGRNAVRLAYTVKF
jgi:hypothetical protein